MRRVWSFWTPLVLVTAYRLIPEPARWLLGGQPTSFSAVRAMYEGTNGWTAISDSGRYWWMQRDHPPVGPHRHRHEGR